MSKKSDFLKDSTFHNIIDQIRQCRRCESCLPHTPRPVIRGLPSATLLIVGQAPGLKVHETGLSFNDHSGDRLRSWLGMNRKQFYDERAIALIPVGLCFPGRNATGADLPPLKECAPFWHPRLIPFFPNIKLTLLVGGYAQKFYLKERCKPSLTETVQTFQEYLPHFFPLPHPSWRNNGWLKCNPWFETDLLPALKKRVHMTLSYIYIK